MAGDPLFSLNDKIALVTGGTSGIGRMIASGLVERGVMTMVTGRNADRVTETVDCLSRFGECVGVAADVTSVAGRNVLREALEKLGRLDILVNNAGTTYAAPIEKTPPASFDRVLQTNVAAPFSLIGVLLPVIRSSATGQAPARIINIASIDAIRVPPWDSFAYSASKAAIAHLTRHLAKTLAKDNITVNAIAPGIFPSRMTRFLLEEEHPQYEAPQRPPLGRLGEAEDIVGAVVYLASRAGAYLTGTLLPVSGGLATAE